jgi:hypothetical protein
MPGSKLQLISHGHTMPAPHRIAIATTFAKQDQEQDDLRAGLQLALRTSYAPSRRYAGELWFVVWSYACARASFLAVSGVCE